MPAPKKTSPKKAPRQSKAKVTTLELPFNGDGPDGHTHDDAPQQGINLLPGHFVSPVQWGFDIKRQTTPDEKTWVILRIEHPTGSCVMVMDSRMAQLLGSGLIKEAVEADGPGLIVPDGAGKTE
jgi:hypothetical protein